MRCSPGQPISRRGCERAPRDIDIIERYTGVKTVRHVKDRTRSHPPRRRVLHIMTTFSASSGAAENTRLTLNSLPRDRFDVFLALPPRQSMEPLLGRDVTRLPVRHLVRPLRPLHDIAALIEIYKL